MTAEAIVVLLLKGGWGVAALAILDRVWQQKKMDRKEEKMQEFAMETVRAITSFEGSIDSLKEVIREGLRKQ